MRESVFFHINTKSTKNCPEIMLSFSLYLYYLDVKLEFPVEVPMLAKVCHSHSPASLAWTAFI